MKQDRKPLGIALRDALLVSTPIFVGIGLSPFWKGMQSGNFDEFLKRVLFFGVIHMIAFGCLVAYRAEQDWGKPD
jgi:hypothetical protein